MKSVKKLSQWLKCLKLIFFLWQVHNYWAEKGAAGFTVFKYRLKRLPGQPKLISNQVISLAFSDNSNIQDLVYICSYNFNVKAIREKLHYLQQRGSWIWRGHVTGLCFFCKMFDSCSSLFDYICFQL